ncbi:MAG: polysaccharide biosynthesis/export family protein [Rhodobacteraceae bacterium]|nr:polysaccharide biosynthesis/export family protein [Paracoccaceae bacterium]
MQRFTSLGCALITLFLAGCGATYVSPTIGPEAAGAQVQIVALDIASVARANAVPYTPRTLPAVFFANAGTGAGTRVSPDVPDAPLALPSHPALTFNPPPQLAAAPYRIGVGDVVLLATRRGDGTAADLAGLLVAQAQRQGYSVRDDGQITLPDIGQVRLVGLTMEEAEMAVFDLLVAHQIDPAFSLEIQEFQSQFVAVGGAVHAPKRIALALQAPTLADVLAEAGGLDVRDRPYASIRLYRNGNIFQIPLETYLATPDLQARRVQSGDAIFVDTGYDLDRAQDFYRHQLDLIALRAENRKAAQIVLESEIRLRRDALDEARANFLTKQKLEADARDYVYLTGEVDVRGRKALPYGKQASLMDVLYGDGGFSPETGDPSQIYVLRKGGPGIVAWHLDARNAAALVVARDMQMRPGDIVFVEEQRITKFHRALSQTLPALITTTGRIATQ